MLRRLLLASAALVVSAGCADAPSLVLRAPDAGRDGLGGRDGPLGATRVEFTANVRVTEAVEVQVYHPTGGAGPYPLVVMVQGGAVELSRYAWLAEHLATRGFVTLMARHPGDLAILAPDDSVLALAALRDRAADPESPLAGLIGEDPPRVFVGHSLGGVVATGLWLRDGDASGLVLLASYPADGEPLAARTGPVLSITGDRDGASELPDVEAGVRRFSEPRTLAVVQGMNHYAWTDRPTPAELEGDGENARPVDALRRDALAVIDTFLDAVLEGDEAAAARLARASFAGVEVREP